jgi:tetratricopeptide (TPR) repeat protein
MLDARANVRISRRRQFQNVSSPSTMTRSLHALAVLLALGLIAQAQTPVPPPPVKYPPGYVELIQESVRTFNEHDYAASLAAVAKADQLMPPSAITLNTRGAIAVEERRFDEGRRYLEQALKLDPKFYPARFNLGEIPLMEKNYAQARAVFEKLLAEYPKDELILFRVFLCHLLQKDETAARQALDKIPFPGDTPAYYFANAAWEFAHENPTEANKWVARGNWVFTPDRTVNFLNSIYEIGWMERPSPDAAKPAVQSSADATPTPAVPAAR